MKVALVHDYLNQLGGGERVLRMLADMFPEAEIYTLIYDKRRTHSMFSDRVVHVSFLDNPLSRRIHRLFIPFMPLAARNLRIPHDVDLVISDTAGFSKGVSLGPRTKHVSYIHTPLRYAWETDSYFKSRLLKFFASPAFAYLRRNDYATAQAPDMLIANSRFIAQKIKKYYQCEAEVIYPAYNETLFYADPLAGNNQGERPFLAVGRLLGYKRFDLIIEAFNELNLPLLIVGEGPARDRLKRMIRSPHIQMIPFVSDDKLRELYASARALIFPSVEDFGLVMVEAVACGTPVIAYNEGGAREIVQEGINGLFFSQQSSEALQKAVREFEKVSFDTIKLLGTAQRFTKPVFEGAIRSSISKIV